MNDYPKLAELLTYVQDTFSGVIAGELEAGINDACNEARVDGMRMAREEVERERNILPQLLQTPTASATCDRLMAQIEDLARAFAEPIDTDHEVEE